MFLISGYNLVIIKQTIWIGVSTIWSYWGGGRLFLSIVFNFLQIEKLTSQINVD